MVCLHCAARILDRATISQHTKGGPLPDGVTLLAEHALFRIGLTLRLVLGPHTGIPSGKSEAVKGSIPNRLRMRVRLGSCWANRSLIAASVAP